MSTSRFWFFVLAIVWSLQVNAVENSWSIKPLVSYQYLEETGRTGATLVEESGMEPAIEFSARRRTDGGTLGGKILLSSYTLDYEGRTQSGRPVDTETEYQRLRTSLGYSHDLTVTSKLSVQLEAEWASREINGVGNIAGLSEETQSYRLLLGIEKAVHRRFLVELVGVIGLSGTQTISSAGIIDETKLPEGRTFGARTTAIIHLTSPDHNGWKWALMPSIEYLHSERSEDRPWLQNGVVRGTLAQPETRRWSVGAGLMATW